MKSDLSWEEFINAFNELATPERPDPGIHRIWHHLGKGSVTTIGKYKQRLKMLNRASVPQYSGKMPDAITQAAGDLFNALNIAVDERQVELEADIDKRHQEIEDELSDLRNKVIETNKVITGQTKQLDIAATEVKTSTDRIHELELELEKANSAIQQAKGETEKVTALNIQLSKTTTDNEAKFKESLTAELNNTLDAKKQLTHVQDEKVAAHERHTTEIGELKQAHNKALQKNNDEMVKMNGYYEQQLKERDKQIKNLEKLHTTSDNKLSTNAQKLTSEQETNKQLTREMATSTRQTEKLQDKVESLTVSLVAANDSIKELKDEKKDLLSVMRNIKSTK